VKESKIRLLSARELRRETYEKLRLLAENIRGNGDYWYTVYSKDISVILGKTLHRATLAPESFDKGMHDRAYFEKVLIMAEEMLTRYDNESSFNEDKVARAVDRARELFAAEGYNCAMAVMSTLSELADGDSLDHLCLAAPFCGGMARAGLTCGALTGAVMAVGMIKAPRVYGDREAKEEAYRLSAPLVKGFMERMGSALCAEITGVDISTPEDRERMRELKILETR
jgi:C_GCAxxG_C_C family probable redox protein